MNDDKKFIVKDSGQRQAFSTGSVRDLPDGKGRYDLIPTLPLRRLALHYENGSKKYGDRNWEKGQNLQRYVASAMRHLESLRAGEPTEDHAIAACWNLFAYVHTLNEVEAGRLPRELDDRPAPEPQYAPAPAAPAAKPRLALAPKVDAWIGGGCLLCGKPQRDDRNYVHDSCNDVLSAQGIDLKDLVASCA